MASPINPSTAKTLEDVAIIQREVDALKATLKCQFPLDSAVLRGTSFVTPQLQSGQFILITNVVLPEGIEHAHAEQHGSSHWSFTAKVVTFQNGTTIPYFLKVSE